MADNQPLNEHLVNNDERLVNKPAGLLLLAVNKPAGLSTLVIDEPTTTLQGSNTPRNSGTTNPLAPSQASRSNMILLCTSGPLLNLTI